MSERIYVKVWDNRHKRPVLELKAETADEALRELLRWAWNRYPEVCRKVFGEIDFVKQTLKGRRILDED